MNKIYKKPIGYYCIKGFYPSIVDFHVFYDGPVVMQYESFWQEISVECMLAQATVKAQRPLVENQRPLIMGDTKELLRNSTQIYDFCG